MEEYDVKDRDKPKSWPKTGHDVAENKTVFIRNLSFDTDQVHKFYIYFIKNPSFIHFNEMNFRRISEI